MSDYDQFDPRDPMVDTLTRIAKDLERVIIGVYISGGLLGAILFVMILRTMLGR